MYSATHMYIHVYICSIRAFFEALFARVRGGGGEGEGRGRGGGGEGEGRGIRVVKREGKREKVEGGGEGEGKKQADVFGGREPGVQIRMVHMIRRRERRGSA